MKLRKLMSAVLIVGLMSSLAACGGSQPAPAASSAAASSETKAEAAAPSEEVGELNIIVANTLTDTDPHNVALNKFKETLESKSGGKMKVTIYSNGALGGETTAIEGVQGDNITLTFANVAAASNYVPECEIFDIPFLFESNTQAAEILNDKAFLDGLSPAFSKVRLKLLGCSVVGFRWLTSSKPVESFDDIKGLKVRTMENKNHMALWGALGANATPISGAELMTSLQQKVVDGQENPLSLIFNGKINEVNNYLVDTRHIMSISAWMVSDKWYSSLSDAQRAIFDEAITTCMNEVNTANAEMENQYIEDLKAAGMTVVIPDDAWRTAMVDTVGDTVEKMVRADIGDEAVDTILKAVGK